MLLEAYFYEQTNSFHFHSLYIFKPYEEIKSKNEDLFLCLLITILIHLSILKHEHIHKHQSNNSNRGSSGKIGRPSFPQRRNTFWFCGSLNHIEHSLILWFSVDDLKFSLAKTLIAGYTFIFWVLVFAISTGKLTQAVTNPATMDP